MNMKQTSEDWRVQAIATIVSDVPAAYPGGPSHKKGSKIALSSVTKMQDGSELHYLTPSAIALALSIAINASNQALKIKPTSSAGVPTPNGPSNIVSDHSALYGYFEQCLVAATFSFLAIEAYANYKIAYFLKGDFEFVKNGKIEWLLKEDVERRFSTDEKLSLVLPKLLNVDSPKGQKQWEVFIKLKRLRDSTIHLKSHHQWTTSDNYDDSPYTFFLRESPRQLPIDALNVIKLFSGDPEKLWLEGADKLIMELMAA
jgi:hypothetical protein